MSNQIAEFDQTETPPSDPGARGPLSKAGPWRLPAIAGAVGLLLGIVLGMGTTSLMGKITADNEREQRAATAKESALAEASAADKLKIILPHAVAVCGADKAYAVEGDNGLSLTIDNKGEEDYLGGLATVDMMCIFRTLNIPTAVTAHMEQTTSMDGRQTEAWDNLEVSWSYHPDRGMDSVVTIVK